MKLKFELTNEQRKYLGLIPVKDYDMLISVSESISYTNRDIAYLQYGLIYREIPFSVYEKLIEKLKIETQTCRNECISFGIYADDLKECIKEKSNSPY